MKLRGLVVLALLGACRGGALDAIPAPASAHPHADADAAAQVEPRLRAPVQRCIPRDASRSVPTMDKRSVADALLARDEKVQLHLDARRPGVVVPAYLADENHLVLEIGYHLPRPIPDLRVDAQGVTATLSFHEQPFKCTIPWSAVYVVIGDERGEVYQNDIPPDAYCP